jgi:hypothetical protein
MDVEDSPGVSLTEGGNNCGSSIEAIGGAVTTNKLSGGDVCLESLSSETITVSLGRKRGSLADLDARRKKELIFELNVVLALLVFDNREGDDSVAFSLER